MTLCMLARLDKNGRACALLVISSTLHACLYARSNVDACVATGETARANRRTHLSLSALLSYAIIQGPYPSLQRFRREALGRRGELVTAGEESETAASQRACPNGVGPQARECAATPGRRAVGHLYLQGTATFVVERFW